VETEVQKAFKAKLEASKADSSATPKTAEDYLPTEEEVEKLYDESNLSGSKMHEDFRKFRTKLKHATKEAWEARKKLKEMEEYKKKVEEYETGAAMPELVAHLQQQVAELESYKELHNFKGSRAYREKFVKPIEETAAKLKEIATDYGIPEGVIDQVTGLESNAEINALLSQHIRDELGASEVKSLVRRIQAVRKEAAEVEKNPKEVMARVLEEATQREQEEERKHRQAVAELAKSSWTEALVSVKTENRIPELMYKPDDIEHNEKVVRPILARAGQEYGKIVATLADNGLKYLPKDVGTALGRMTQLAHLSGVLQAERERLSARVTELEGLLSKYTNMYRPGLNAKGNNGVTRSEPSNARGVPLEERGARLLKSVI
jgi:hypothetical protein